MDLMNCLYTFYEFFKENLKGLIQVDWSVNLIYTFYDLKVMYEN